jgi:hypothetical protein
MEELLDLIDEKKCTPIIGRRRQFAYDPACR